MMSEVMNGDKKKSLALCLGNDVGGEGKNMWCIHCASLDEWRHFSLPSALWDEKGNHQLRGINIKDMSALVKPVDVVQRL